MRRLLALVVGGLGLRALLRRRARPVVVTSSPAEELKAKLAGTKEPEPQPVPEGVDERRADVYARARHAIEELRERRD